MSVQREFCAALLTAEPICPPGLVAWNQSDAARRFGVYRNNVIVSLVDALADTFPVTQELVGSEFFRAMARLFAQSHPPRSPVMAAYGAELPAFIESFAPASGLPYLADLARLEFLRTRACHAADAAPVTQERIVELLADPAALPVARLALHPSMGVLRSPYAVVSLWAAHQTDDAAVAVARLDPSRAEAALVLRAELDVEIFRIADSSANFIVQLQRGCAFGPAAEYALAADPTFDLGASMGLLVRSGGLTGVTISRSTTP